MRGSQCVRVQSAVVLMVIGFMPQQETVGACVKEPLITVRRAFSHREGDRTVFPAAADGGDDVRQPFIREPFILAALKDKSAKAEGVTLLTAGEDILF